MLKVFVEATDDYKHIVNDPYHAHPIDGVLKSGGSWWTKDEHTCRLQRDGVLTHDGVDAEGNERLGDTAQLKRIVTRPTPLPTIQLARKSKKRR